MVIRDLGRSWRSWLQSSAIPLFPVNLQKPGWELTFCLGVWSTSSLDPPELYSCCYGALGQGMSGRYAVSYCHPQYTVILTWNKTGTQRQRGRASHGSLQCRMSRMSEPLGGMCIPTGLKAFGWRLSSVAWGFPSTLGRLMQAKLHVSPSDSLLCVRRVTVKMGGSLLQMLDTSTLKGCGLSAHSCGSLCTRDS